MKHFWTVLTFMALLAFGASSQTLPAISAMPTPIPGFSAQGTLAAHATQPMALSFQANVAVMHLGHQARIDLLSLEATGDKNVAGLVKNFFPQGGITIVIDQRTKTATFWSSAKHAYYQSKNIAVKTTATPKPKAKKEDDTSFLDFLKGATEYSEFNASMSLKGHEVVNGQMSSVYNMTMHAKKNNGETTDVNSQMALGDNISGIPVHLNFDVKGQIKSQALGLGVAMDLTSLSQTPPAASVFAIPAGYKKVSDIVQLVMPQSP